MVIITAIIKTITTNRLKIELMLESTNNELIVIHYAPTELNIWEGNISYKHCVPTELQRKKLRRSEMFIELMLIAIISSVGAKYFSRLIVIIYNVIYCK